MANFSDKALTLRSPLPVAEYHTVSGVSSSATLTEIGVSPAAPNHPYWSVIDRNIEDDKQESTERENRRAKVIQTSSDGPLSEPTSTHCLAYLDDIIIWAPSLEEHLHRLRLLFDRIRTAALKLKPT